MQPTQVLATSQACWGLRAGGDRPHARRPNHHGQLTAARASSVQFTNSRGALRGGFRALEQCPTRRTFCHPRLASDAPAGQAAALSSRLLACAFSGAPARPSQEPLGFLHQMETSDRGPATPTFPPAPSQHLTLPWPRSVC